MGGNEMEENNKKDKDEIGEKMEYDENEKNYEGFEGLVKWEKVVIVEIMIEMELGLFDGGLFYEKVILVIV